MNEKVFHERLKNVCYKFGYAFFGEKSGGALTTTLLKRKGLFDALDCFAAAAKSANPKDYLGGVLRQAGQDLNNKCEIGTVMGNYMWDGSKWKEIA